MYVYGMAERISVFSRNSYNIIKTNGKLSRYYPAPVFFIIQQIFAIYTEITPHYVAFTFTQRKEPHAYG